MPSLPDRVRSAPASKELIAIVRWWIAELQRIEADIKARLPRKSGETLQVTYSPEISVTDVSALTATDDVESWDSIRAKAINLQGKVMALSVQLPRSLCLVRTASYPSVSADELSGIIGLELVSTTPFTSSNAAWTWLTREDGQTDVVIVKRGLIEKIRSLADRAGVTLKDIRLDGTGSQTPPFEIFETPETKRVRFWRKVNIGLASALTALIVLAYGISYVQKSAALDRLRSEIAVKTKEAREMRTALNRAAKAAETALELQALKTDRSSVVENWARITKVLPPSAWLSELMLGKDGGTIAGFSGNAASLIELLERNPAFKDVAFATAIRIDPHSKAERFEIRFAQEATK